MVKIDVFELLARRVAVLQVPVGPSGAGTGRWGGMDAPGRRLSSGVYFLRLRWGEVRSVSKAFVLR